MSFAWDDPTSEHFLEEVARQLKERATELAPPPQAPAAPPEASGYHRAAAVLAWFDPDTLKPAPGRAHKRDLTDLRNSAIVVRDQAGARRLSLAPEARVQTLRALRLDNGAEVARAANSGPVQDPAQAALDMYLLHRPVPLDDHGDRDR